MKMFINCGLFCLFLPLFLHLYNMYMGICMLHVVVVCLLVCLKFVKHFESPKALYKFPILIKSIMYYPPA